MKRKKLTISEQLASLSVQYGVYPAELFQALIAARENKKTQCQGLAVEYRGTVDNEAIFLIKQNENVIVQFRVPEETLRQKDLTFENWMDTDKVRRQMAKLSPTAEPTATPIAELRQGMKKVTVAAKVVEIQKPRTVHTQFGNIALLANAVIEDDSGKMKLCLWDQQVNAVAVGDTIEVSNASVSVFKGEKQLRLGKTGSLVVTSDKKTKAHTKTNAKNVVCA